MNTPSQPLPQYAPTWKPPGRGLHVAALVLGIVGTVLGLIPLLFLFAWICGLLAVIFGFSARRTGRRVGIKQGRAGLVLGVVALGLGVRGSVVVAGAFDDLDKAFDCIGEAETAEELEQC